MFVCYCLRSIKIFTLKIKLNKKIKVKFVIFSKKLLSKVPIFFINRLGSSKVYQKKKKKVSVVI
jgi:hypothetical protein